MISPGYPVVYVAGPYTSDPEANVRNAIDVADKVWRAGLTPFVPHLSHFWDALSKEGRDYDDWMRWCFMILDCINSVVLLRIPGESAGADAEVEFAKRHNIPVFTCLETLISTYPVVQGGQHIDDEEDQ